VDNDGEVEVFHCVPLREKDVVEKYVVRSNCQVHDEDTVNSDSLTRPLYSLELYLTLKVITSAISPLPLYSRLYYTVYSTFTIHRS
jgi:hypothetical protein